MKDKFLTSAAEFAINIAEKVSDVLRQAQPAEIREKSEASDLQTDCDVLVEDIIRSAIGSAFPTHAIIAEERGRSGEADSEWEWYVDPIDGTCNFANGLPWYSVSITLMRRGQPVVGVIAAPALRQIYHATLGGGAYVDGRPIHVATTRSLRGRIALMELANHARWPGFQQLADYLESAFCTLRIMGSSALSLAHVALGASCGVAMASSNPIDVGAGVLLVREAGGIVLGASGERKDFPRNGLVAGPEHITNPLWNIAFS
ncbi:inositol monophosphatase family protein [Alicyclobacillus dauci]|uniref:Inositol-1-monophosphatase n=1 Tax=Alicyclobacillus dauci TaxID=1475485 RepID=A0ABY6Z0A0_9BACL|nr:inositol monophosphatase family protein [Alicyclobacillus dauci]WAH36312.1 inositol monophosphatase [Alicyclobacillus dauci]